MNYDKVVRFSASIVAILGLLLQLSVSPVVASELILPQELSHDGLTFSSPLSYATSSLTTAPVTITFMRVDEVTAKETVAEDHDPLYIEKPVEKTVLAEEIVLPTPKKLPEALPTKATLKTSSTPTPTTTVTQQPKATDTPTPTPTTIPATQAPVALSNGGLNADKLFDMSNAYRASQGLPALQKDDRACQLAASRAPEIGAEIAEGHMHSGLKARNLPYWNTENIISYRTEEEAFNWWINDKIHHDAIVGNYTYSCVACFGNSCAQEFTNFQPK